MTENKIRNHLPAWIHNDIDLVRFIRRIDQRSRRYPSWRQVFYDCSGICQYPIDVDGSLCGNPDTLEFHEIYGKNEEVLQIVLLCNYHHYSVHNGIVNPRHYKSMLQLDVDIEIKLAGGLDGWKEKYQIVDRSVIYDFESSYQKSKDDLQYQED